LGDCDRAKATTCKRSGRRADETAARGLEALIASKRKILDDLKEAFWVVPGLMVLAGVVAAYGFVRLDHSNLLSQPLLDDASLYRGGPAGARAVLGAIASSTIAVAGTVFSITIAALSLAAGQMGPRLLRNFTRDRGNQITLGAFIGTFVYALLVLRTVRSPSEGEFVPHVSLTVAILLAFVCVATLVWFVAHMAERINVDTVIDLVSCDIRAAIDRFTTHNDQPQSPPLQFWQDAAPVVDRRCGYLQQLDRDGLADWAAANDTSIRLLVRPGDYVFPNAPIALLKPPVAGADEAIRRATALGSQRRGAVDIDFTVAQLVEVAVRALSSGVNDPQTAISVLDRLGSALCQISRVQLPGGGFARGSSVVLVVPTVDYDGLLDVMLQMIRQNAAGKPAVLNKLLQVLTVVATCEKEPSRTRALQRHADRVLADAERSVPLPSDLDEIRAAYANFADALRMGAVE
jgi:uncharacterized membrane protein